LTTKGTFNLHSKLTVAEKLNDHKKTFQMRQPLTLFNIKFGNIALLFIRNGPSSMSIGKNYVVSPALLYIREHMGMGSEFHPVVSAPKGYKSPFYLRLKHDKINNWPFEKESVFLGRNQMESHF
jgi:hypothetical protein